MRKLAVTLVTLALFSPVLAADPMTNQSQTSKMQKESSPTARQTMIHQHSPMVMPFDMNRVTHHFVKNKRGGILRITVKDSKDKEQLEMVRQHLNMEAHLFSDANFRDPTKLHGEDMPGVKKLEKSKGLYTVKYKVAANGAQITFASKHADVVAAFHIWFDAQLKDHAKDAVDHF